ncbi:2B18 protein, partial [Myiagra hebetior]|nr:2B18 protein [Myiagra hebetior]
AHTGVFQRVRTAECYFTNGTEKVRFVERYIYNRQQIFHFDSDVGHYVGDTPYGETQAQYRNSLPDFMEDRRAQVDTFCRPNYDVSTPFLVGRRGPPSPSQSIPIHLSP